MSATAPLISNLDVCVNIALIRQYHQNLAVDKAKQFAVEYLKRFGMEEVAYKRNPSLSNEERFCVMLLRAAMVDQAVIVLDRPFNIISDLKDSFLFNEKLLLIADLFKECHIFDYSWLRNRYRIFDDAKN